MEIEAKSDLHTTILSMFVAKAESLRGWMEIPFKIGDKAYATDGHALVFFDAPFVPNLPQLEQNKAGDVLAVIPNDRLTDLPIPIAAIVSAMQKAPIVDGFDVKNTTVNCDACDGNGEVEFEFYHNGKTYYSESDCPLCDGTGKMEGVELVPNGTKVADPNFNYSINGAAFSTGELNRILQVAKLLECDSIKLTHQAAPMGNHVFKIGNVEILQMPLNLSATDPETIIPII